MIRNTHITGAYSLLHNYYTTIMKKLYDKKAQIKPPEYYIGQLIRNALLKHQVTITINGLHQLVMDTLNP